MATIKDVAQAAGVSISTVSYALSGKRSVGRETQRKVMRAVHALGYEANAGARMLAGQRRHIIALVAPMHAETHAPTFMDFVLAVVGAAQASGYHVLLLTETDAGAAIRQVVSSQLVDAVVLMDVGVNDPRMALLRELNVPAAVIGLPRDREGLTFVDLDFEAAAELIAGRLAALGHREIGLVGHARAIYQGGFNFALRFRAAFEQAMADRGIRSGFVHVDEVKDDALAAFAASGLHPTALVLNCNERGHRLVLDHLARAGRSIPGDISVISACASFDVGDFAPPLDVVPLPTTQSAERAVELALRNVQTPDPHVELIPPTLVDHGSSGPAPGR